MSDEIVETQERAMTTHSFVDLLRRTFEQTPGNSQVELRILDKAPGGATLAEIAFRDYPLAFSWAGVEAGAKTVILRAEREPRGSIRARVLYLTEEQAQEYDAKREPSGFVASLSLIEEIRYMQWNFWDERTEEWVDAWDPQQYGNRRPSLVNLYLQFYGGAADNIVFWIPTMANPETFTRGQGAGGGRGGPNDDGDAGGPGGRDGGGRDGRGGRDGGGRGGRDGGGGPGGRGGRGGPGGGSGGGDALINRGGGPPGR
jgi:hypothetical protein